MNLYHVHVTLGDQHPAVRFATDVYARTPAEAIAGALSSTAYDRHTVTVVCDLQQRDVVKSEIRGGIDVLHADCFPS